MATPFCVFKTLTGFAIAMKEMARTNQNPNKWRRRFSPPSFIWVLCPK